jgi:hypothetical protein
MEKLPKSRPSLDRNPKGDLIDKVIRDPTGGPVELGVRPRPLESFPSEFTRAHRCE